MEISTDCQYLTCFKLVVNVVLLLRKYSIKKKKRKLYKDFIKSPCIYRCQQQFIFMLIQKMPWSGFSWLSVTSSCWHHSVFVRFCYVFFFYVLRNKEIGKNWLPFILVFFVFLEIDRKSSYNYVFIHESILPWIVLYKKPKNKQKQALFYWINEINSWGQKKQGSKVR